MDNIKLDQLRLILNTMTVSELKEIAKLDNLNIVGKKEALINRIYDNFIESKKRYKKDLSDFNSNHEFVHQINDLYCNVKINEERNKRLIYRILNVKENIEDVNKSFNLVDRIIYEEEETYDAFVTYLIQNHVEREKFFERFYPKENEIENLESKYLELYYYFFLFYREDILKGLKTKYEIEDYWKDCWDPSGEISDFSVGAERVIYTLINGRGIGNPNSSPVGSDLFFELDDSYIHMDLKTVSSKNIGDYVSDIFVGNNQNSYNGRVIIKDEEKIYDDANLPTRYKVDHKEKITLTYFITILYDEENLNILCISLLSMPNGELYDIYGSDILNAGKIKYEVATGKRDTHAKTIRYDWSEAVLFETLCNKKRIKVIYLNEDMDDKHKEKLVLINKIYNTQSQR